MSKFTRFIKDIVLPDKVDKERREKILSEGIIETWTGDEQARKAGIESLILTSDKADEQKSAGVRLCTMHRAKGLEFKAVAIPFMSSAQFPPKWLLDKAIDEADREDTEVQFKSLLHVAATRAKAFLRVSWSGEPSKFFKF